MSNVFNTIPHFKFWCQKVLPLVYDDSLSYEELLCKVVTYLNHVIDDINAVPDYIKDVLSDENLKQYLNEILDDLRIQIARINEGKSETATADRTKGELLWLDNKLAKMTRNILAGDRYIEDTGEVGVTGNFVYTSVEIELNNVKEELEEKIGDLSDLDTDNKTSIVIAINEAIAKIGDLSTLDTSNKTSIVLAINEVLNAINTIVGDLDNLETTDKTNVVSAINDVLSSLNSMVGDLNELDTIAKNNLVNAINSFYNEFLTIINETKVHSVKEYGASGLDTVYTGVVSGNKITIQNHDYKVGNGIVICNAGINPSINAPRNLSGVVVGSGSISHTYKIAGVTYKGGMSQCASVTLTGCPTSPDVDNFVRLSWTRDNPNNVDNYAIYRDNIFIGFVCPSSAENQTITFEDYGAGSVSVPPNISSIPPTQNVREYVDAIIIDITGDELTLDVTPSINGEFTCYHNDRKAIQEAIDEGGSIYVPTGEYNVFNYKQSNVFRWNLTIGSNTVIHGDGETSIIKNKMSYMAMFLLCNKVNAGQSNGDNNVYIHDIQLDGCIDSGFMSNPKGQFFANTGLIFISKNGNNAPTNYVIKNCSFINAPASTCVFAGSAHIVVDGCMFNNVLGGPSVNNNCLFFKFINNTIINSGDDAISCNAIGLNLYNSYGIISGNIISSCGSRGIIAQGSYITIENNVIRMCASTGILIWNLDGGGNLNHITINGNIVFGAGKANVGVNGFLLPTGSIYVGGCSGIMIGCWERTDISALVAQIMITNNSIDYSNDYAIRIYNHGTMYIDKLIITNNLLGDKTLIEDVVVETQHKIIESNI